MKTRGWAGAVAPLLAPAAGVLAALVASPSAGSPSPSPIDALPAASERLAHPVLLPRCGMRIVEWRPTAVMTAETAMTQQAVSVVDQTCSAVLERLPDFLRAAKMPHPRPLAGNLPAVSLLPANPLLDGKSPRSLNDLPTRFEAVAPGCCYWGLYVDVLDHLFLRNDPLLRDEDGALVANPHFVRVLTHEMWHVLGPRLGVWDIVPYDRARDDALADELVAFMGIPVPAETAAEDLAIHGLRAAP